MKTKIYTVKDYFDRMNEAGKHGPATWIICSQAVATVLNEITKEK